jgi:hypothetical protein
VIFSFPNQLNYSCASVQSVPDFQKHSLSIGSPLVIPEAQLFDVALVEKVLSPAVQFHLLGKAMQKAIEFNAQLCCRAVKVKKVWAEGVLASKFESCKAPRSQRHPQLSLLGRLLAAEASRVAGWIHVAQTKQVRGRFKKPLSLALSPLLRRGEREFPGSASLLFLPCQQRTADTFVRRCP